MEKKNALGTTQPFVTWDLERLFEKCGSEQKRKRAALVEKKNTPV